MPTHSPDNPFPASRSAALAFCITAFAFLFHALARQGFELQTSHYASGLALAAVLHFGPVLLAGSKKDEPGRTSLASLLLILLTVLAGWTLMAVDGRVEIGLWVVGALVGGSMLWQRRRMKHFGLGWVVPTVALLYAIWMAACFWSGERAAHVSPLFLENMAKGSTHVDTLFHSSLASMMQTYQVASTGLDGVVFMPYHWGSHLAVAGWSRLCGMLPLEFYTIVFLPVFLPWMLVSLLELASVMIARLMPETGAKGNWSKGWLLGVMVLWLSQQHVTIPFVDFVNNCKVSQSFVLSVIWFVHFTVLVESFFINCQDGIQEGRKPPVLHALGLLGLFALGVYLKISSAVLFGATYAVIGLLKLGWRTPRYWLIGGALGLVLAGLAPLVVNLKSDPLAAHWSGGMHDVLAESGLSYAGYYTALFWPWLLALMLVVLLVRRGALGTSSGKQYWSWLAMAAGIAVLGELPNWLMPSSGSGYFSKVMVTVMPVLLVTVVVVNAEALRDTLKDWWHPENLVLPQRLILLTVATVTALAGMSVLARSAKDAGHRILAARRPYVVDEAVKKEVAEALKEPHLWHAGLVLATSGKGRLKSAGSLSFLKDLIRKGRDPLALRREEALFVPRANEAYWNLLYANTIPYVVPALTRRCHVFGLPDPAFKGSHYGLVHYPHRFEPMDKVPSAAELEAARLERCPTSVKRVLVVDEKGDFSELP